MSGRPWRQTVPARGGAVHGIRPAKNGILMGAVTIEPVDPAVEQGLLLRRHHGDSGKRIGPDYPERAACRLARPRGADHPTLRRRPLHGRGARGHFSSLVRPARDPPAWEPTIAASVITTCLALALVLPVAALGVIAVREAA